MKKKQTFENKTDESITVTTDFNGTVSHIEVAPRTTVREILSQDGDEEVTTWLNGSEVTGKGLDTPLRPGDRVQSSGYKGTQG